MMEEENNKLKEQVGKLIQKMEEEKTNQKTNAKQRIAHVLAISSPVTMAIAFPEFMSAMGIMIVWTILIAIQHAAIKIYVLKRNSARGQRSFFGS